MAHGVATGQSRIHGDDGHAAAVRWWVWAGIGYLRGKPVRDPSHASGRSAAWRRAGIAAIVLCLAMGCAGAWAPPCLAQQGLVGVNVNSLQNVDAAAQREIVRQLAAAGVRAVRTSLRDDDKNIALARLLQDSGIDWCWCSTRATGTAPCLARGTLPGTCAPPRH